MCCPSGLDLRPFNIVASLDLWQFNNNTNNNNIGVNLLGDRNMQSN